MPPTLNHNFHPSATCVCPRHSVYHILTIDQIIPPKLHSAIDQPTSSTTAAPLLATTQPQTILTYGGADAYDMGSDRGMSTYMVHAPSKSPSDYTATSWISSPRYEEAPATTLRQQWRAYQGQQACVYP